MRKVHDRSEIFPVFHDLFQRRGQQLGHAAVLLQQLLDLVAADHQLVQTDAAAIALVAFIAAERAVQGEPAVLAGIARAPAGQHGGGDADQCD